jgi:hypothetical protein
MPSLSVNADDEWLFYLEVNNSGSDARNFR